MYGFEGSHYTCTYDFDHLPRDYDSVRKYFKAFRGRADRWRSGKPYDWVVCIEGRHGDHRYHVHLVLRDSQFSPAEVRYLWRGGEVDDEPLLRKEGGYRRIAEYFNKERPDGFIIPINKHPWSCNRPLSRSIPPPEEWDDESGVIEIPDDIIWARRGQATNDFGAYYYGSYILPKKSALLF